MGTLKTFLDSQKITAEQIVNVSKRTEKFDVPSRAMMVKRSTKRRVKDTATKSYAELSIEKPKQMGRGVGLMFVQAAIEDKPVTRKTRAKIFRAVSAIVGKKGGAALEFKALFEGSKHKVGKKAKAEAAK